MKTKEALKSDFRDAANSVANDVENSIDGAAETLARNADALRVQAAAFEEQLRKAGNVLLRNAKQFSDSASKQARLHPLAAIGLAFVAGAWVAKSLQR